MNKEFVCVECSVPFVKYVPPSDSRGGVREFCSRSCQMKHTRRAHGAGSTLIITTDCAHCKSSFTYKKKASQTERQFCGLRCSTAATAGNGARTNEGRFQRWVQKYGHEEAVRRLACMKEKRSEATIKRFTGKQLSEETKEKISRSCEGIPNAVKGKTFVEFYGPERGAELGRQHSEKLKAGFAEGRLTPTARSGAAPVFRGVRLRSLLEARAIEHLERKHGLVFGDDLQYEPVDLRVTWYDGSGGSHTYHPDLVDRRNSVVYEVKPAWIVDHESDEDRRKRLAATEQLSARGLRYAYLRSDQVEQ